MVVLDILPIVRAVAVTLDSDSLRREITRRSTECVGLLGEQVLAKSEIDQFHVALRVQRIFVVAMPMQLEMHFPK